MKKTALVSGGAGFIGRRLVPALENLGYSVTAFDAGSAFFHSAIPLRYDVVVHLAANIRNVNDRLKLGVESLMDISLDLEMFRYIQSNPPRECFIYPSSCAVDNPADPYGFVKIAGERGCDELWRMGVPVVILRPFSGYGPGQTLEYPFPAITKRILDGENPVTVWGSGEQIRDWLYIDDLISAFIHAIDKFPRGVPVEIGTGVGIRMVDLVRMVCAEALDLGLISTIQETITCDTSKEESSPRRVANVSMASEYRWYAKTSLREGIRRYLKEVTHASSPDKTS